MARRNPSISTTYWGSMIGVATASILVVGHFWISREYREFERGSAELRVSFLDEQRAIARNEVEKVIDYIEYRRSLTEERLKASLRERVDEAHGIALHLYQTYRQTHSRQAIEQMIKEALRPIRFNRGRGYYFAVNLQGIELLYPVAPHLENSNLLDLQDEKGNFVIRDEIEVIKKSGEGFVMDYWRKPNAPEGMIYPKMTFVKHLQPFDWYLGTGEYLDDFERDLKDEIIDRVASVRFGKEGYVFINTYKGDAVITNGRRVSSPLNLWDLTDIDGNRVIQMERQACENPEGDFIYYTWIKLSDGTPAPKVSFIKGLPDWQWMIGAGVYLDEVDEVIAARRQRLRRDVLSQITKIVAILASLGLLIVLLSRYFLRRTKRSINAFTSFFNRAATEASPIDASRLHFSEFRALAEAANRMIADQQQVEEDKKLLQERLVRSRKMEALGLLTGGVAHDLNNILSGIVTYPELLLMNPKLDTSLRRPMETIYDSGLRAAAVVADLLAASRGSQGVSEILSINDAVSAYLDSPEHQHLVKDHPEVTVDCQLDPELWSIGCSRVHLAKTLMNLVANGVEALNGHGQVRITTACCRLLEPLSGYEEVPAGDYARLEVADSGSGITASDLARIFEPFFTKKVLGRSGTGLGLTVVWHTVHDNAGYIDVTSSPEGTVFSLYFPRTEAERPQQLPPMPVAEYRGQGETILVVDDEPSQRQIAGELLESLGYQVSTVASGEAALAWLAEHDADLVVLDMILGSGKNGCETYEEMTRLRPQQRAIIASGYAETEDVKRTLALGAGAVVRKPYTLQRIGVAVRQELERE